jgi:nucleotide-binding universal stress UspA family protein
MQVFPKILVAYDGSENATRALRLGARIAKLQESALTVINVYTFALLYTSPDFSPTGETIQALEGALREKAQEIVDRGVEIAREEGVTAKGEVADSESEVEGILDFAEKGKFDLIVIGSRGLTGFKKLVLGSVSSGVVSHSTIPVLIVK